MDLQNEEIREEMPRKRKSRRPRKPRFQLPFSLPGFLANIGQDVKWYWDVRLYSPLILLLLLIALIPGKTKEAPAPAETRPVEIVQVQPQATEPAPEPIDPEAEALARLADSVGAGRTDNVKIIIMWVAVNRSEAQGANGYGLSIQEEIDRPNQWQGYDENMAYSEGTYQLAKEVIRIRDTGALRPLDSGMYWFVLNENGSITVRNQFTATKNQPWIEKTVS